MRGSAMPNLIGCSSWMPMIGFCLIFWRGSQLSLWPTLTWMQLTVPMPGYIRMVLNSQAVTCPHPERCFRFLHNIALIQSIHVSCAGHGWRAWVVLIHPWLPAKFGICGNESHAQAPDSVH